MSACQITDESIVNQAVQCHPETIAVFNDFGIDTCCGGGVSIRDAARRDGVDVDHLMEALRDALTSTSGSR